MAFVSMRNFTLPRIVNIWSTGQSAHFNYVRKEGKIIEIFIRVYCCMKILYRAIRSALTAVWTKYFQLRFQKAGCTDIHYLSSSVMASTCWLIAKGGSWAQQCSWRGTVPHVYRSSKVASLVAHHMYENNQKASRTDRTVHKLPQYIL